MLRPMTRSKTRPDPMSGRVFCWSLRLNKEQPQKAEFFRLVLNRLGFGNGRIAEEASHKAVLLSIFFDKKPDAERLLQLFNILRFKNIAVGIKIVHNKDWLTRWKDDWKPFALTKGIDIVPAAHKQAYRIRSKEPIFLDTVMSFGTGLHETTRFTAGFIAQYKNKFHSFLDIGTGTGILALVALKCGAGEVYAVDINAMSIDAAKANYKANGHKPAHIYRADIKHLKLARQFDYVAANLITHDLIALRRKIMGFVRPSGILAVSGISLGNLALLCRSFRDLPLRCLKVKKGREWAAVLYRRRGA